MSSIATASETLVSQPQSHSALLALDLGSTSGWAIRNTRGRIFSGSTAEFKLQRFEGGGMRYLRFSQWLDDILKIVPEIDVVYFEEVRRHIGTDAAHAYGGFLATLTSWCEEHGVPYGGVPVGTIKQFITGKGNADKATVMAAVRSRGFPVKDNNEADAVAILLWAIAHTGGAA